MPTLRQVEILHGLLIVGFLNDLGVGLETAFSWVA